MTDYELHGLCKTYKSIRSYALSDEDILSSGKFKMLDKLLPAIKQKVRVLYVIFTCYQGIIDFLAKKTKLSKIIAGTKTDTRVVQHKKSAGFFHMSEMANLLCFGRFAAG